MSPAEGLMSIRTVGTDTVPVVELDGVLARGSAADLTTVLRKTLLDRGRVLVDARQLRLASSAGLALFPSVLARVGGWPEARLVLVAAPGPVAEGMRATGRDREVPVAADLSAGLALLERRPARVRRTTGLPRAPEGTTALARALCATACADWGIDRDATERLVLVANELVTNALQHTENGIELGLTLDDNGLRASVRDGRPPRPPVRADDEHLGLRLVTELSDNWGVTPHPDGKTVWASFRTAAPAAR